MSTALAVVQRDEFSAERVALIKRTVCPKGITDDEFSLFLEQCRRTGLDPLIKQAFCVPRRKNIGTKDAPKWIEAHEFQAAEAGMLARAEDFPDYRGCTSAVVREGERCDLQRATGAVDHISNPTKQGKILGAWARVVRDGRVAYVAWVDFAGYVQSSPLWQKIPATMIEKCARVAALRLAFPKVFGGVYIPEEMPQEEPAQRVATLSPPPVAKLQAPAPQVVDAEFTTSKPSTIIDVADGETEEQAKARAQATPPPAEPSATERLLISIGEAQSQRDLEALLPAIKARPKREQDEMRPAYTRRASELAKGGAK